MNNHVIDHYVHMTIYMRRLNKQLPSTGKADIKHYNALLRDELVWQRKYQLGYFN